MINRSAEDGDQCLILRPVSSQHKKKQLSLWYGFTLIEIESYAHPYDFFTTLQPFQHTISLLSFIFNYSETLNFEYVERIHQCRILSANGMLQIFSFLIKWL